MADIAVIETGGKQYTVRMGETISIELLPTEAGKAVIFKDLLSGREVAGGVVRHGKGKKKIVFRYKQKTRHRVKKGHRQLFTQVKIQSIS